MLYLLSRYFEFGYLGALIHDRTPPKGAHIVPVEISKCDCMNIIDVLTLGKPLACPPTIVTSPF